MGGVELRFCSLQPDIGSYCETVDTDPVYHIWHSHGWVWSSLIHWRTVSSAIAYKRSWYQWQMNRTADLLLAS